MGAVVDPVEGEPEQIVVVGEALAPEDGPGRVTVVRVAELPAGADLASAVERAPGVVVRRLGGLGDLAQVGLRGAGARHTEVLLDGLPLNPEGGSAVDLSELPLRALDRIEVWRGSAPALLGTTALGGALALWTRTDPVLGGSFALGSPQTARGSVLASAAPTDGWSGLVALEGLATDGRFRWFDDGGTRGVVEDDDPRAIRENNDTTRLTTTSRLALGPVTVLHAGTWSEDGVPGFVTDPTSSVRYGLARQLVGVRADARGSWWRGWALDRRELLLDPAGEVGVGPQELASVTSSFGADGAIRPVVSPDLRVDLGLGARLDGYRDEDRLSGTTGLPRGRRVGRVSVGAPWSPGQVEVRPSATVLALVSEGEENTETSVFAVPRLAAGVRFGGWQLSVDGGGGVRPPDLLELFGDRGAVVGNPALRAETGWSMDAGLRRAGLGEVAVFGAVHRDLVVFVPSAQGPVRPENLDDARTLGVEASATLGEQPATLVLVGTLLDARQVSDDPQVDGRFVPRVPPAELLVVGTGWWGPARASLDTSFTAATWADRANVEQQSARLLFGATAAVELGAGWSVELDVRNLLGTRSVRGPRDPLVDDGVSVPVALQDFGGYPLPGRTALATLVFAGR